MQHSGDPGDRCQVEKQQRSLGVCLLFILCWHVLRLLLLPRVTFTEIIWEGSRATRCASVFIANTGAACQPQLQATQLPFLPGAVATDPSSALPTTHPILCPALAKNLLGRATRGEGLGAKSQSEEGRVLWEPEDMPRWGTRGHGVWPRSPEGEVGPSGVLEGQSGGWGGQDGEFQPLTDTLGTLLAFLLFIEPQVFMFPPDHVVCPASLPHKVGRTQCFRWDLCRTSSGPSLRAGIRFPACPQAVIGFPQIL